VGAKVKEIKESKSKQRRTTQGAALRDGGGGGRGIVKQKRGQPEKKLKKVQHCWERKNSREKKACRKKEQHAKRSVTKTNGGDAGDNPTRAVLGVCSLWGPRGLKKGARPHEKYRAKHTKKKRKREEEGHLNPGTEKKGPNAQKRGTPEGWTQSNSKTWNKNTGVIQGGTENTVEKEA